MATRATTSPAARISPVLDRTRAAIAVLDRLPPVRVLAAVVAANWLAIVATAAVVRHHGWIYYQGGDQLWYYTLGWLLDHGQLTQTVVGYLWSALLAPLAAVAGPNLVNALPAIVLVQVLVLLPIALVSLYGIAARVGGKLFGYWVLLLWTVAPFIGVLYTNQGYHQRYTELLLPQAFGLTAMADFPTMVAALVSAYFAARAVFDAHPRLVDGVAAGVFGGVAIGIKPSTSLYLLGPALALLFVRRFAQIGAFVAGISPAVLTLAVWKARGLGNVPLLHSLPQGGGDGLASAAPLAGIDVSRYVNLLNWSRLGQNIDLLREHFWSGRFLVWLVLAGLVGLFRRSRTAGLLVGGWFFAFAIVKGSYMNASVEDGSVFRVLMPSYPAFILLLASIPLLLPHLPPRLASYRPGPSVLSARARWAAIGVVVLVSAVVPLAAIASAGTARSPRVATLATTSMPIPANVDVGLSAVRTGKRIVLRWHASNPLGGPVFYRVWRSSTDGFTCPDQSGAPLCNVTMPEVGVTREATLVDAPPPGTWFYRVLVAANWLNDPQYGDPYFVSRPLRVVVP